MSFAIAILEENGFFHCSIRGKGILPLQFRRKMGFAIAVLEEKGLTQVPKDRIEGVSYDALAEGDGARSHPLL